MIIFFSILIALSILIIISPASGVKLRNYFLKDDMEASYFDLLIRRITGIIALFFILYYLFNVYLIQQ